MKFFFFLSIFDIRNYITITRNCGNTFVAALKFTVNVLVTVSVIFIFIFTMCQFQLEFFFFN